MSNLYLSNPQTPFVPPPSETDPDAPLEPSPGPGAEPDVPNAPSPDNVPDLSDQPEPDPEMPDNRETDA